MKGVLARTLSGINLQKQLKKTRYAEDERQAIYGAAGMACSCFFVMVFDQ